MTAYVFLGPTLSVDAARPLLDAVYLPPVRHGDVWRVAAYCNPSAIAIIDGYFEHVPSVWHKEILWAMSEGIPVFGASSMGALRAAELEQFGMVGIGLIFAAYRDGVFPPYLDEPFEDDDEVAVVHGPAESGYPSSEAMVNIRRTLAEAADQAVISGHTRDALAHVAKALFYKDRSYANLLKHASGKLDVLDELDALRTWLPKGKVDQKQEDARALLEHLRNAGSDVPAARFRFERTTMWEHLLSAATEDPAEVMVLTELRLEGPAYLEARQCAVSKLFKTPDTEEPLPASSERTDFAKTQCSELSAKCLEQHARDETRQARKQILTEPLIDTIILEHLRQSGHYNRLLSRAIGKKEALAALDMFPPEISDVDRTPEELTAWFSVRFVQAPEPDPTIWATYLHFDDTLTFLRALAGENIYANLR